MNKETLLSVVLIFFIAVIYTGWRKYAALQARENMAALLDQFLGSDAPEAMKNFAFTLFHASLFWLFAPVMLLNILFDFSGKPDDVERSSSSLKFVLLRATELQRDEFKQVFFNGFIVVFKRAPLITFICLFILLVFASFKALINKLTLNGSISSVEHSIQQATKHYN